jgi:hypothetical protein
MEDIRDAIYENLSSDSVYRGQRDKITVNGLTKKTVCVRVSTVLTNADSADY